MAEASIQFLLENLTTLIKGEIGLILGVNDDINKLSSNLTTIQAVLQDAEAKQFDNESIRNWLRKLNHLSFEIEDVLDECVTQLGRLEFQNIISKSTKKILYKHKIARRIKQVTAKLEVVAAERANFHLSETTVVLQGKLLPMRQTGSVLNAAELVIGRDEEREEIIDILLNKVRYVHQLSVLPIIGLGGLGKTTLARLVFNDKRVTEHFDIRLWVCVSDDFDQKTLIKAMIRSATKDENDSSNLEHLELDPLQRKLSQLLNEKRYLLVLDDVWNDDQEKWLELKNQLACGKTGSSIIVTTRQRKVADIMETTPAHNLKGLSEEYCWLLFKERAFGHEEGEHTKLETIGRQIVKKCAGVPLAATTLGGLLRFERREDEWIRVEESPIWRLQQNESSILPALRLSYNHLPLTHRYCFAYCAVFPKDSQIEKEELICQWMAHGYISSDGTSDVEEIGDKIFNELVLRSLLLNVTTDDLGIISFQMHDLVHDLAQSIMENKVPGPQAKLDSMPMSSSNVRHVNLKHRYAAFPWRSLPDKDVFPIVTQFNRLRSLDARWSDIEVVPRAIGKLKQLRYLNLSYNYSLQTLPEELCSLWNLKILDLSFCLGLKHLPTGMRKLRNLCHLFLEQCQSLGQMAPKIGELTSLKTMSVFIAGQERNNQIGELQWLDLLGGKLEITNLERVEEKHLDVNKPILAEKQNLRDVELRWERGYSSRGREESLDEKVLQALEPHANVETLIIVGFKGKHMPLWMKSSSVEIKLIELHMHDCNNCLYLPKVVVEGPHLKKLKLLDLRALKYIDDGCALTRVKFPVLEELELRNLMNLKGLLKKETGECFPNLKKLSMWNVQASEYIVEDEGCDLVRVKFPVLEEMKLSYVTNLKYLLTKETGVCFPNLKQMNLEYLRALEYIVEDESYDLGRVKFPALEELELEELENLKGLLKTETGEFFPNLRKLYIRSCPSLLSLPHLPSLVKLDCSNRNITSVGGEFENLSTLIVTMEVADVGVPKECLTNNLKSLTIYDATQEDILPEEGLQGLKSLKVLTMWHGRRLRCLPGRWLSHLTSLEVLELNSCYEMVEIAEEIKYLHNLRKLGLCYLPKMVCLPNGLQHCTALESLSLIQLQRLESLPDWLGNITSLQTLLISLCPKIVSIPSSIQQLTQLQTLDIRGGSPELEKRCKKGKGDDWHKIAHIPNIHILGDIGGFF